MTIADECIDCRARHGLTQDQLASLTGFTRQTIINVEQGRSVYRTTEARIRLAIRRLDNDGNKEDPDLTQHRGDTRY